MHRGKAIYPFFCAKRKTYFVMRHTFKKEERLKSAKVIKMLFSHGNSFLLHPFKINWKITDKKPKYPARVLVGVSKKNFKKASERNHMKRLCREAYRKNKHFLYSYLDEHSIACDFTIIYIGKVQNDYAKVEKKIIALIERLITEIDLEIPHNISNK